MGCFTLNKEVMIRVVIYAAVFIYVAYLFSSVVENIVYQIVVVMLVLIFGFFTIRLFIKQAKKRS
jgi:heme O synthase-like polyprenyltransferase